MASLQDLIAQRDALERQIELTKKEQRTGAIDKIRALMREYDLSVSDLSARGGSKSGTAKKGGKVAAKYRNTATGETWSGRGLQPKWLKAALAAGRKPEDFAV
ncbi:MAG: H-NS histone family protein [Burkholderiaceae bacterium]